MKMIKNLTSLSSLVPLAKERGKTARTVVLTGVAVARLVTALVRTALATPASNILWALLWLILLCASAPQTFAQGGIPLWTNRYNGPANSGDLALALAVDSNGNVFVMGGYGDYVTIKYSSILTPPRLSIAQDCSGGWFIRHTGVPDLTYRLQGAANLTGPWFDRATNIMPPSGFIELHETSPAPSGYFYRAIQP
jgi:hypothetical protein